VDDVKDPGPALTEPIVLSPAKGSEQRLTNFGEDRGVKKVRAVRLLADKRLPGTLTAANLGFTALLERAGDTLESIDFSDPTFTEPRISADRRSIEFTICLSAAGLSAGKYIGNVTITGPEGLGEARVGVTANLKARWLIWLGSAMLAIAIAGAALYLKDRTTDPAKITPGWWYKTGAVLVVAFGAMLTVYLNDNAWGASVPQSLLVLIGSALASVGGRKLIE
jgi:hypothetical protein